MSFLEPVILMGILGTALISGIFFAFSVFIMAALARMPNSEGIRAMQYINKTVITPLFLIPFMGTALLSLFLIVGYVWIDQVQIDQLLGGLFYFFGTFGVTMVFNVPLNEKLASMDSESPEAVSFWEGYLKRWTLWNHVRTCAGMFALFLLIYR